MKSYQVSMYSSIHSYSEPKIVHALAKALIERGIPFNFDGDTVEFSMSETMKSRLDKDGDKDLSIIDWQKAEVK